MSTQNVNRSHMYLGWLLLWLLAKVDSSNWLNWLKWIPKRIHFSQKGDRLSH